MIEEIETRKYSDQKNDKSASIISACSRNATNILNHVLQSSEASFQPELRPSKALSQREPSQTQPSHLQPATCKLATSAWWGGGGTLPIVIIGDVMELNKWYCSLIWCPSQCYRHVQDHSGTHFILYLRWRWDDPWQAHIVKNAHNQESMHDEAQWSGDVFEEHGLYFTDEQLEEAKTALLEIWVKEYMAT